MVLRYTVVTIHVPGFQTVVIFMQTGVSEKPVARDISVRNILMEVATAFGPIKAYYFKDNAHPDSPCAFVELQTGILFVFMDSRCTSLSGIKLGGQVMNVTQATPYASLVAMLIWSSKAVDQSGAIAIQAAEVRATGSTLLITGGLAAQAQSASYFEHVHK
nr:hypothetical protein [Tanacetum cinerariifolium]